MILKRTSQELPSKLGNSVIRMGNERIIFLESRILWYR
jgi:hypothetical protein